MQFRGFWNQVGGSSSDSKVQLQAQSSEWSKDCDSLKWLSQKIKGKKEGETLEKRATNFGALVSFPVPGARNKCCVTYLSDDDDGVKCVRRARQLSARRARFNE